MRWPWQPRPPEQTCFIYCPNAECRLELIAANASVGQVTWVGSHGTRIEGVEKFLCPRCDTLSYWDFDAPAPLLLESLYG